MTISQNADAPLVAVVGATGTQGGSVIQALKSSEKPYRIRGFTRDTTKPGPQELIKLGVEMVAVSLGVENKEEVYKAFEGATFAFIMTDFWKHSDMEKEIAEGKMLIDAAIAAKVKLIVWSGLSAADKCSEGKFVHIDHFTGKGIVTAYGRETAAAHGIRFVNVEAGLYMSNYVAMMPPQKQEDGSYVYALPVPVESTSPLLDTVSDYGLFVRKAMEASEMQNIYAYGEELSYADLVKQMSEITGKKVTFKEVSKEEYEKMLIGIGMSPRLALEMYEMFAYIASDVGYFGTKDIQGSRAGLEQLTHSWADFVKATDWSKVLH